MKYISRTLPLFFFYIIVFSWLEVVCSANFPFLGKERSCTRQDVTPVCIRFLVFVFQIKNDGPKSLSSVSCLDAKTSSDYTCLIQLFFLFESFFCNLVEILILIYKRRSILTRVFALIHIFITFYLYRTVRSFVVYNPSSFSKPLCSIQTRAGDRASCPCASHKKPKVWQFSSVSQEIVCYTFLGFLIEQERGSLKPIHKNYN